MALRVGPIELTIAAAGVGLVVAAVRNVTPLEVVRQALGATSSPASPIYTPTVVEATPTPAPSTSTTTATGTGVFTGSPTGQRGSTQSGSGLITSQRAKQIKDGRIQPTLVPIPSQPSMKLDQEALTSLLRVFMAYGRPITMSGTFRSREAQARGHAENPDRFAAPGTSAHEVGLAVDIDMNKHNVEDPKLVEAFLANGWFRVGRSGHMHWSYGVPA